MSEGFTVIDRRGVEEPERKKEEGFACRVCGSVAHSREYNAPSMECVTELRNELAEADKVLLKMDDKILGWQECYGLLRMLFEDVLALQGPSLAVSNPTMMKKIEEVLKALPRVKRPTNKEGGNAEANPQKEVLLR